jgi:1-acyl-sn-glycerol-3-phosphate acyltransferase
MPRPTNVWMKFVGAFFYWLSYVVVQFLARVYWRGDLKGFENVPKSGPYLICPVHRSNADGPLVVILTTRRIRYMAKDGMFKINWLGNIYRAMGSFPVNRDAPDRESLKRSIEVLENGEPLVLFPEGTRKEGPRIEDVHEGAAYLALKANVPIIPVGLGNTEKACPKKKILLRPVKIRMIIGEPIWLPRSESGRVSRPAINEGTEIIRQRLQALYDQSLGKANV